MTSIPALNGTNPVEIMVQYTDERVESTQKNYHSDPRPKAQQLWHIRSQVFPLKSHPNRQIWNITPIRSSESGSLTDLVAKLPETASKDVGNSARGKWRQHITPREPGECLRNLKQGSVTRENHEFVNAIDSTTHERTKVYKKGQMLIPKAKSDPHWALSDKLHYSKTLLI